MASRFGPQIIPRGGSGNATVPPDAPIQPPQAFVDVFLATSQDSGNNYSLFVNLASHGIGTIAPSLVVSAESANGVCDLSGNAITNTDAILASLVLSGLTSCAIDLSGGTNAAPTQTQMNVSGAGTGAINGSYTQRGTASGKPFFNLVGQPDSNMAYCIVWTGTKWVILNSLGFVNYSSANDTTLPSLATFSIGSGDIGIGPAPTLTSTNADQATLVAAGWTVTTN